MTKTPVAESAEYDNFLGKKVELPREPTLTEFLETEDSGDMNPNDKDALWVGMPEFEQEDKKTYKTMYLHFRNKEDFDKFVSVYRSQIDSDQTITVKTKSMWYPALDRTANHLLRWVEEE
jgi:hypothetical protein